MMKDMWVVRKLPNAGSSPVLARVVFEHYRTSKDKTNLVGVMPHLKEASASHVKKARD